MGTSVDRIRNWGAVDWDKLAAMLGAMQPRSVELAPATIELLSELFHQTHPSGVQEPRGFVSTGSGMTPDRVASFSIINKGEAAGTVAGGMPLEPEEALTWNASPGKVLSAVPFDATGTKFKVIYVVDVSSPSEAPQDGDFIRPLIYIHEQIEPTTEVEVHHNWGIDPLSVTLTREDKSNVELSWQFSKDANSVKFRSTTATTFRAILLGFPR